MQEITEKKHTSDFDDELDLKELFFILVQGKWIIACVTAFFSIAGVIYSLYLPNIYESEAMLAPVDKSSSLISGALNQYSGLAGLAGIELPSGESDSNSEKAIEVLKSLSFFENNILPKIFLPDLMAAKSWDKKNNTIIYDNSIFQKNSNTWILDSSDPKKSIPSAQKSFEEFKSYHFNMQKNNKTGYVILSIKHLSPSIAKQWVEIFVDEINAFYRQKDKAHSEKAVVYLNKQMMANSFSEIRQATASLLEKEIQKLTLIEANKDYVFEYIYPPSIMEEKSEPIRSLIIFLSFLLGMVLGIIIVLFRHYFLKDNSVSERISN